MFLKQKKLMAKCRACGHEQQLDSTHRAGTHLMKQLPKEMSEIETKKEEKKVEEQPSEGKAAGDGEAKKEKKAKKSKVVEEQAPEEVEQGSTALRPDSEEIGKYLSLALILSMMNTLSLPLN